MKASVEGISNKTSICVLLFLLSPSITTIHTPNRRLIAWFAPIAPEELTAVSLQLLTLFTHTNATAHYRYLIDRGIIPKVMRVIERFKGQRNDVLWWVSFALVRHLIRVFGRCHKRFFVVRTWREHSNVAGDPSPPFHRLAQSINARLDAV